MSDKSFTNGVRLQASSFKLPIFWLTGNTGAGKTTLASGIQQYFNESTDESTSFYKKIIVLDGDEMRATISTEETLTAEDRRRHNLRVARLAKHLQSQGFCVIVSVIAPFTSVREEISQICDPVWVYIKRTQTEFSDRPYEVPSSPDCVVDHDLLNKEQAQMCLRHFMEASLAHNETPAMPLLA